MTIDVAFIDSGCAPQCKADPKWPNGMPVNLAENALQKTCTRNVPYPAPRCGMYEITCRVCGYRALITVAGRADDPSMVTIPCGTKGLN